jgi:WD repeat-containing protein 1 (actin-interacting protein 1)
MLSLSFARRPASYPTEGQPKSLAIAADTTIFLAEPDRVEAIRANQKVFELKTGGRYVPSTVAAIGSVVAIGGEVRSGCIALYIVLSSNAVISGSKSTIARLGR